MTGNEAPALDYARKVEDRVLVIPAARSYGSRFGALVPGEAEPAQTDGEEPDGGGGGFRGGVIRALAGFVRGYTAAKLMPSGPFGATADRTAKIVAPASGDRLVACGRFVRPGRAPTVVALALKGGEESLRATVPVAVRDIGRAGAGR